MTDSIYFTEPDCKIKHEDAINEIPEDRRDPTYADTASLVFNTAFSVTTKVIQTTGTVIAAIYNSSDIYKISEGVEYVRDSIISAVPRSVVDSSPEFIFTQLPCKNGFKNKFTYDQRRNLYEKLNRTNPDHSPVVVEKSQWSKIGEIEKNRLLIANDTTIAMVTCIVRRKLNLNKYQSLWFCVGGFPVANQHQSIRELYIKYHENDGFLYLKYHEENVFG